MRKRILSVLLCLVMLTGLFPAAALAADEEAEGPAAQVGGQTYSSLKAAITAAGEGGTITLLRDYRQQGDEDAVLLDLTDKTLDLNGFTYHFGYACHFTGSNGTSKIGDDHRRQQQRHLGASRQRALCRSFYHRWRHAEQGHPDPARDGRSAERSDGDNAGA